MGPRRLHSRLLKDLPSRVPTRRPSGLDGPAFSGNGSRGGGKPQMGVPIIVLLTASLVLAGLLAWRWGVWSPRAAQAQTPAKAPSHRAVEAALDAAQQYVRQGQFGKAEAILRQGVAEHPEDQDLRVALGEALMGQRRYADAYEQYEKALAIGPREAEIEFTAGTLAYQAGMPERSVEHYSMAQTADPSEPRYPLYLGQVQARLGQYESAKASLLRAAMLDDTNAFAWGTLADLALRENNIGIALQHIAKARHLQPNEAAWRLIEARAMKRKGEPEQALAVLLSMDPVKVREPATARLIAECYGMLGRAADAAAILADASDALPADGGLALEAAAAAERAGMKERATILGKRAQAAGNDAAAKLLERLGN